MRACRAPREEIIADDREHVQPGDQVLLIVEDDPHYARVLLGLARDKGFKGIVATRGNAALALARQYQPTAITLDIFLPDMLGWTVLNNLKLDPPRGISRCRSSRWKKNGSTACRTARSPTWSSRPRPKGWSNASTASKNFVAPRVKRLLVVEDNEIERKSIVELLEPR